MSLSVIVPTFNMGEHLPALARAFASSGLDELATEVIVVDDGSTDDTSDVLARLGWRFIRFEKNLGRYAARLAGAEAARGRLLLFMDVRLTPPDGFADILRTRLENGSAVVVPRIDVTKSVYNLYWERTHALIFRRNRRDETSGFEITPENYDAYVTGTGGLLCHREHFLAACAVFEGRTLLSDDTLLMRELIQRRPLFVRDDFFAWWEPRQTLGHFLARLWERGPGFAEYHVFARRGLYFYILLAAAAYVVVALYLVAVPTGFAAPVGLAMLISIPAALLLSTVAFAKSPLEVVRLAPLHLAVCATAALSVTRGILKVWTSR